MLELSRVPTALSFLSATLCPGQLCPHLSLQLPGSISSLIPAFLNIQTPSQQLHRTSHVSDIEH